jgi:aromatic-L-amino-acid decarboxylase
MDCSCLWTSRPDDLRRAFRLVPEYLTTPEHAESLSDYGPSLGRRFRALKLWAVLRCYGRRGIEERVGRAIELARTFAGWVADDDDWELAAPPMFSLVCFRRRGSDAANEGLLEAVNASGEAFLSHTRVDGRYALRLAVGHERTTRSDVERAWDLVRRLAEADPSGP